MKATFFTLTFVALITETFFAGAQSWLTTGNSDIETGTHMGLGNESPSYQLHLSSNSAAKPASSTWTVSSDLRLKKEVRDFTDGLNVIQQIQPVWFRYTGQAGMPGDEPGIGTIAQELQKVAPYMVGEWIYTDGMTGVETGYLNVDYHALFFMFINAFKEQQRSIEELQTEISELKIENSELRSRMEKVESILISSDNDSFSKLPTGDEPLTVPFLGQNTPNPFDNSDINSLSPSQRLQRCCHGDFRIINRKNCEGHAAIIR